MPKDIDQDVVDDDLGDTDLQGDADLEDLSEDEELLDDDEDAFEEDHDDAGDLDDEDDPLGDEDGAPVEPAVDSEVVVAVTTGERGERATEGEETASEDEDDEEMDDDDVEASLDVILKERLVVEDEEQEDDDEPTDAEDRTDGALRVLPKQPGEFVCRSCFLVKSETQLADPKRLLCRDCV